MNEKKPTIKLKKLTTKGMGCRAQDVRDPSKAPNGSLALAVIGGIATGLKSYEDQNGEISYGLVGQFEGQNLVTGETFEAGITYLPDLIMQTLGVLFNEPDAKPVEFGYMIRVQRDDSERNARGYTYQAVDLVKTRQSDPLAEVKQRMQDRLKEFTIDIQPAIQGSTSEQPKIEAPKVEEPAKQDGPKQRSTRVG